jgi:hypothetical protein
MPAFFLRKFDADVVGPTDRSRVQLHEGNRGAGFAEARKATNDKRRLNKMPRGDKGAYTDKQKRKAEHIEDSYEERGVSRKEAEARAWATVNKESGGGKKSGSGRGKKENHSASKKGGKKGGTKASKKSTKKSSKKSGRKASKK